MNLTLRHPIIHSSDRLTNQSRIMERRASPPGHLNIGRGGTARFVGILERWPQPIAPALVDRKRHIVGSLAGRAAAAAIGAAWSAAAGIGHRDLRRAGSGNVGSGDHDTKR